MWRGLDQRRLAEKITMPTQGQLSQLLLLERKLSFKTTHIQFHRQCIDGWLRSGQLVCPIDGTTIQSRAKKQKSLEERRKIGGRERMGKLGQDRQSSMPNDCNLSLCGQGIGLPQIIK